MSSSRERGSLDALPLRVLLVEDDVDVAGMYRLGLELAGCQVFVAGDGPSALEGIANQARIDVLVLDLTLPQMDGLQVLTELNRLGFTRQMPVIVLSNRVQDFAKALALGASQCLEKCKTTPSGLYARVGQTAEMYPRGA